jgi:hypothetical protein
MRSRITQAARRGRVHDVCEDLLRHRGEEAAKHNLIADVPGGVIWVYDLRSPNISVGEDGLRWRVKGAVDVAEQAVPVQVGEDLRLPQHEVGGAQLDDHGRSDGWRRHGGGRRHLP